MDGTSTPVPQHIADPLASAMQAVAQPYVLYKVPPAAPYAAYLDLPTLLTLIPTYSIPTVTASATLAPGYYPNGVSINNGVTVTLAPTSSSGLGTLFVFGGAEVGSDKLGPGLTVNGGALIGHGVTCYVTENVTAPDGGLGVTDWGAGSAIDLWSPGDWQNHINGTEDLSLVEGLNGVAVWQDPNMRYQNEAVEVHLNGTPGGGVHGTLYFPDPIHVFLNGDLGQMGNQILCGSATVEGNATISVDFDGRNAGVSSNASNLVR